MSERRTWRPSSVTCGHGGRHELAFPLSDQEQRDDPAADPCRRHRPVCAYGPVRASRQLHRGRAVRGHGAHLLRREDAARDFADPAGDLPAVHGHPTVHHGSQPRADGVAGRGHLPRRGGKMCIRDRVVCMKSFDIKNKVSIIIPVYNEEENIDIIVQKIVELPIKK